MKFILSEDKHSSLIGKEVTITTRNSPYYGEWGIVKYFDGDDYHIALWDGNDQMIFSRDEFKVKRNQNKQ